MKSELVGGDAPTLTHPVHQQQQRQRSPSSIHPSIAQPSSAAPQPPPAATTAVQAVTRES